MRVKVNTARLIKAIEDKLAEEKKEYQKLESEYKKRQEIYEELHKKYSWLCCPPQKPYKNATTGTLERHLRALKVVEGETMMLDERDNLLSYL